MDSSRSFGGIKATSSLSIVEKRASKCHGSAQECEKPADSTNTTVVVVAVVVPVVVVIVLLGFILYKVYRRNKKEELEDNDPDFDGDVEYLPDFGQQFEMNGRGGVVGDANPTKSSLPSSATQAMSQPNPFNDDSKSLAYSNNGGMGVANPFQLPSATDDSKTLRNFARSFQNSGFDGYKLASHSASQVSISRPSSAAGGYVPPHQPQQMSHQPAPSSLSAISAIGTGTAPASATASASASAATASSTKQAPDSEQLKKNATILKYREIVTDDQEEDPDQDSFDLETSPVKSSRGNVRQSHIDQYDEGFQPEVSMQESEKTAETELVHQQDQLPEHQPKKQFLSTDDDVYIQRESEDSDEDVERMKSIYQVYLDRNGTVKTVKEGQPVPEGFQPAHTLPEDASKIINAKNPHEYSFEVQDPEQYQEQYQGQEQGQEQEQGQGQGLYPENEAPRVASSIYEAQSQYGNQNQYYNDQQYYGQQQYDGNYPGAGYHGTGYPAAGYANRIHIQHNQPPPNLESIEELPRPSNLPYSSSTHSLTSFKSKGSGIKSPTAALMSQNNRGYNPIDHPQLYYHHMNGSDPALFSDQTSTNTTPTNMSSAGNGKILPHHLRQSVVMTNPHELSQNSVFKPAGSFSRAVSDSRSNSLMSNTNTYQQHVQNAYIKSRVSGLLDDNDFMHPPSMGNILPHSGSQEDLRKQLGTSHNYNL